MSGNATGSDNSGNLQSISFIIGTFILVIVFLLGVPGNLFIIWSILARARKRSVTTLLILNLACADGTIMCLNVFFLVYLAQQSWVFGQVMCKLLFYLCNTNMYASIMLIMLMSLNRLVAVRWPHRVHSLTRRRIVLAVLAAMWLLVFILALPALIFRSEQNNITQRLVCDYNHAVSEYVVFHFTTETVMSFLLPYGVILGSYICILRRLRQTKFRRRVRSEKLILAIVVTFAVFWLPYHVVNVIQVVAACAPKESELKNTLEKISKSIRPVTSAFAFISSSANPVLYTFAGRSYIKADGLAFMARLFEGTALDSNGRKTERGGRERMALGLKNSDTSNSAVIKT
ncbi:leukotriene B4 receptor 2b [Colossoma macropomum]|uniref:leukotriene B4 receptor 2b n=1 Tax=Colossoma macropomum TaxID=42526 RepID=UPI001865387C|nr:leukotriene B4 receptor 2b [Colossoma macropomum]XP_036453116.1 leukotriene B4 receptor 2b [Colossoma macropomum]